MKNILLVDFTIDKLGGVERIISVLANSLCSDNDVTVCSLYKNAEKPFFEYDSRVRINYLIDNTWCLSSKVTSKYLFFILRAFERVFELLFFRKKITEINSIAKNCDTVIFGRKMAAVRFLPYLKGYSGKIIVREANNLPYTSEKEKKQMLRLFPGKVDTLVLSSDECIASYNKLFPQGSMNAVKIYNPLAISPAAENDPESKTIVGVGRYTRDKGFENLIYAFSLIYEKHTDWNLVLIGSGEYLERYKQLCKKLNIGQAVSFRKSKDIAQDYAHSSICVVTSRAEGYANSLVEAMVCGVPCISVNWFEGVEEIIQDGKNGIVVPLEDRAKYCFGDGVDEREAAKIAEAVEMLIENPALRKQYSEEAIKIAPSREKYSIIEEWKKII